MILLGGRINKQTPPRESIRRSAEWAVGRLVARALAGESVDLPVAAVIGYQPAGSPRAERSGEK